MIKFNKLLITKIIALVVIVAFTVTSSTYGIDLPNKSLLRVPLNTTQTKQRLRNSAETIFNTKNNGRSDTQRKLSVTTRSSAESRAVKVTTDASGVLKVGDRAFEVVTLSDLERIANSNINNHRRKGDYFEFIKVEKGNQNGAVVYIANTDTKLSELIDRDNVWKQRQELNNLLFYESGNGYFIHEKLESPERESLLLNIVTRANVIKLGSAASEKEVLYEFFKNSQQKFEKTVDIFLKALLRGKEPEYDLDRYLRYGPSDPNYSHITHFSWIYAIELKRLIEILKSEPHRKITVVDDATGCGHFILTTAYILKHLEQRGELPEGALNRIHFIGTDYKLRDVQFAAKAVSSYSGLSVSWVIEDIDKPGHADRLKKLNSGKPVDMIVNNHVLEHLNAKPAADYILEWLDATDVLFVSVPLEESLGHTVSAHTQEFTEGKLRTLVKETEEKGGGIVNADINYLQGGILRFRNISENRIISKSAELFGQETVQNIQEVYATVWGRDAYRAKDEPIHGSMVSSVEVLMTLMKIADQDALGCEIAKELAEALQYTRGITDTENFMRPIEPNIILDIAERWRYNRNKIATHLTAGKASKQPLDTFEALWAEWSTYLDYIELAQRITGNSDVDSFEGITADVINRAMKEQPSRTRAEIERDIAGQAHIAYEKADVIGLKTINTLMRIQPEQIEHLLAIGDWNTLLQWVVLAKLHGEGKFYQSLRLYLNLFVDTKVRQKFWNLVDIYVGALQSDYRARRSIEKLDFATLTIATDEFMSLAGTVEVPKHFDFDEAWLKTRQEKLRRAESHLSVIEYAYAKRPTLERFTDEHPVEAYKEGMLSFLKNLELVKTGQANLKDILVEYRMQLVRARALSDSLYDHDYYFWTGAGEYVGQMKSRALHPRYQLYQMEAYAERMFVAAQLTLKDLEKGIIQLSGIMQIYERNFDDEAALYVQEWIANYGPRRLVMFGYHSPDTIFENNRTLTQDRWVYKSRIRLIESGGDPALLGFIASGYTERLRHLLRDGDNYSDDKNTGIVIETLEKLIQDQDVTSFTRAISQVNPYDLDGIVNKGVTPAVTIGVHVHNAQPREVFETLVHMREIDWPERNLWKILGTTSSDKDIAKKEHSMALEFGISRLGITNRQLLKAGNQNRIIPNTPKQPGGESFYFTLDDDYRAASLVLYRAVPILLKNPTVAFTQFPLLFRASLEPGHSISRQIDADTMLSFVATFGLAYNRLDSRKKIATESLESETGTTDINNRTAMSLPFGTSTLIRTTKGKNFLEGIGGFIFDPSRYTRGEDVQSGMMSVLMRIQPESFQQVQAKWSDGIYMSEGWVIGDGVDFVPGGQLQKERWAEGGTQALRFMLLPYFLKNQGIGALNWRSALGFTNVFIGWVMLSLINAVSHILFPIIVFTPLVFLFSGTEPLIGLLLFLSMPIAIDAYIQRGSGLTLRETYQRGMMVGIGTFLRGYMIGTVKGLLFRSSRTWGSFKGKKSSNSLRIIHLCLGLFQVTVGLIGILQGAPFFVLNIYLALQFFYLSWKFHEQAPDNQHEKIMKIAQYAKETFWKKIVKALSFPRAKLGLRMHSPYARSILWLWIGISTVGITISVAVAVAASLSLAVKLGVIFFSITALISVYYVAVNFWMSIKGIENQDFMNIPVPKEDTAIILAERINKLAKSLDLVEGPELYPDFIDQEAGIINTAQPTVTQEQVEQTDNRLSVGVGEDLKILLSEGSALNQHEEILSLGPQKKDATALLVRITKKFNLKKELLRSLGLPVALLVMNALVYGQQPTTATNIMFSDRQSSYSDQVISGQEKGFQFALDQYNTPPKWKVYFADYGEKGSIDVSMSRSIRVRVHGEGNIIVQLIDVNHRNEGGNWQHGLSRVYNVKPGQEYVVINLFEFRDSDPSLDFTKLNRVVVIAGQEAWGITLNLQDPNLEAMGYEFMSNRIDKSAGIPISEHANSIKKAQNEKRTALLTLMQRELMDAEEFKVLSSGLFDDRIKTINGLKDKFLQGIGKERAKALSMLNYTLIDPSQNSNLRRYVYYILKDVIKTGIQSEDLLEPYVKQGKVTQPIAVSFPVFWYVEKEGRELYEYPDWTGEAVTTRRLVDKGTLYGVEGVITDKATIERVLDRKTVERLDYWALVTGIDPLLVNAIAYTETWIGAHPEKFDNIMAIHVEDLYNALDDRGKELRKTLLALYGAKSDDPRLDEVIVTGLILLEQGFNVFSNSNDSGLRVQGYNGYGKHPWLKNVDMSKDPIIGKRVMHVYKQIQGGLLEDIAREEARGLGIEPSFLPTKLTDYKINIRRHIKMGKMKPSAAAILPNKNSRTGL